jgi:hypothetical protein
MKIDRVERRFVELLQAAGGDAEALAPRPAWEAFKAFAKETIDGLDPAGDVDRLLCEAGATRYGPAGKWIARARTAALARIARRRNGQRPSRCTSGSPCRSIPVETS